MSRKIMIVDDVATNRVILKVKLQSACYEILLASNAAEAMQLAQRERPDLVLIEMGLHSGGGLDLCTALKTDPLTRNSPILMLSSLTNGGEMIAALRAGADDLLSKPLEDRVLLARIRSLLRDRQLKDLPPEIAALGLSEASSSFTAPARIAMVTNSRSAPMRWSRSISPYLRHRVDFIDPSLALASHKPPADLYIIEADPSDGRGLQLMSELRIRKPSASAMYLVVLPAFPAMDLALTYDMGADAVMYDGFTGPEAMLKVQGLLERKRLRDRCGASIAEGLRLAMIDPLTGLSNRRYALPALSRMLSAAQLDAQDFSLMILDIDRFKRVNDHYGHSAGDSVLAELARRMALECGPKELLARIGGEEFLFALPGCNQEASLRRANRLRRIAAAFPFVLGPDGPAIEVTISIGLSLARPVEEDCFSLIDRADMALLAAKRSGRNRVMIEEKQNAA